jgi:hypothetical protein
MFLRNNTKNSATSVRRSDTVQEFAWIDSVRIQSLCATGSASVRAAQDTEHWQSQWQTQKHGLR